MRLFKNNGLKILKFGVIILTFLFLIFRFVLLIDAYSVNLIFRDQWDILTPLLYQGSTVEKFLLQGGPHRMGLALLIDELILSLTEWNVRAIAFVSGFYIIVATSLFFFLKVKLFKKVYFSDILIPLIGLTLGQYENVTVDTFPAYASFPLLLVALYTLSWLINKDKIRYVVILILNFLLIFSGFGIFMAFITIFALSLEMLQKKMEGAAFSLTALSLTASILSLGLFFLNYRFDTAVDCFNFFSKTWQNYFTFSPLMFFNFLDYGDFNTSPENIITASVIFIAFLAAIFYSLNKIIRYGILKERVYLIIAVLTLYSLIFMLATSYGRECLGIFMALASRYVTFLIPGFVGLYFFILKIKKENFKFALLLILIILLARKEYFIINYRYETLMNNLVGKSEWSSCYLKYEDIEYCNLKVQFEIYPAPEKTKLKYKLDLLKERELNFFSKPTQVLNSLDTSKKFYYLVRPKNFLMPPILSDLPTNDFVESLVSDNFEGNLVDLNTWSMRPDYNNKEIRQEGGKIIIELKPRTETVSSVNLNSKILIEGDFLLTADIFIKESDNFYSAIYFHNESGLWKDVFGISFDISENKKIRIHSVNIINGVEKSFVSDIKSFSKKPLKTKILRVDDKVYFSIDDSVIGAVKNPYKGTGQISIIIGSNSSTLPPNIAIDNFEILRR